MRKIVILRINHRHFRDHRISTHVGLAARALGANGIVYSGEKDEALLESINKITAKWGGPFGCSYNPNWKSVVKGWKNSGGKVVHLTMYGLRIQDRIKEIKDDKSDLLIIVGSEKVPWDAYELADWNIGVTNQPHSEVAALAITMEKLNKDSLDVKFKDAKIKVNPCEKGKDIKE